MNTNPNPLSVKKEASVKLVGSGQSDALGSTVRLLVWSLNGAEQATYSDYFTELCTGQDLVLLQQQARADVTVTDRSTVLDERFEWLTVAGPRAQQKDVCVGVSTGCVVAAQKQVLHDPHEDQYSASAQSVVLKAHYALAGSDQTLMVLNIRAMQEECGYGHMPSVEQLKHTIKQHAGAVIVAGEFDSWSSTTIQQFQRCMAEAGLFEASMTRCSKQKPDNTQLDYLFFKGVSLYSVESLQPNLATTYSPITATFVVE